MDLVTELLAAWSVFAITTFAILWTGVAFWEARGRDASEWVPPIMAAAVVGGGVVAGVFLWAA